MKRNKTIALSLISLSLLGGITTALTQPVQAAKHDYIWWSKPRTVKVTRNHKVYEIQGTIPRCDNYLIRTKTLKRGQIVKIHHTAEQLWVVQKKGWANGYSRGNGRFWVANGMKGWYSLNTHSKKTKKMAKKKGTSSKPSFSTDNRSVYNYSDNTVTLRTNTTQYRFDNNKRVLTAPFTVHGKFPKKVSVQKLLQQHLDIEQGGNIISYKASGTIKGGTRTVNLKLNIKSESKPITIAFNSGNKTLGLVEYSVSNAKQATPINAKSNKTTKGNFNALTQNTSNLIDLSTLNSPVPGFNPHAFISEQVSQALALTGEDKEKAELYIANELEMLNKTPDGKYGRLSVSRSQLENSLKNYASNMQRASDWIIGKH